jgi:transcriptional regulator with XRE-family HTH domain
MRIASTADLGALIRRARLARGWSQQQAGDAAGVSRRLVNLIEGGNHPNAETWRVLALLTAVGVRLDGVIDPQTPEPTAVDPRIAREADDLDLDEYLARFRLDGSG